MRSMTGFGKAQRSVSGRTVEVEIRSVNNRFLKVQAKASSALTPHLATIEERVRDRIARGSVSVSIRLVETEGAAAYGIDSRQLAEFVREVSERAPDLDLTPPGSISDYLGLPGVIVQRDDTTQADAETMAIVLSALDDALDALVSMREAEGRRLEGVIKPILAETQRLIDEVEQRAPIVVDAYRERLRQRLGQALSDSGIQAAIDDADMIREVTLFADRCDITEETDRLRSHLHEFTTTLTQDSEIGRKLDFLTQEMLRETNTIGAKANDYEIAARVVDVKSALEKLKEQVQNVE